MFAIVVAARGQIGQGSPPSGDVVAEVRGIEDGEVPRAEFDRALARTAEQQGLEEAPASDDPQFEAFASQALGDVLLPRWIRGEAADRGIEVTDEQISERLDQVVEQNFENRKQFRNFVEEQGFCTEEELEQGEPAECAGVQREIEVMILAEEIQQSVVGDDPQAAAEAVPESDVREFYEENIAQFETPETRDVRVIQNEDEEQVAEALAELREDDSRQSWNRVAEEFSEDPVSSDRGGLLEGVVEGQSPGGPAFDEAVFAAPEGELIGPIATDAGFYVAQVENIEPAETTPLEEVSDQIRQQLAAQEQERLAADFESNFVSKWTERTLCAEDVVNERCANAPLIDPHQCTPEQEEQGCPPVVISRRPAAPGASAAEAAGALPQGPLPITQPAEQLPPGGLPPGAAPVGPPGAPPPGGAPPGAAPPGAAPPGGPPGGAPVPPG